MQKDMFKNANWNLAVTKRISKKRGFLATICIWCSLHTDGSSSFTALLFSKIHPRSYAHPKASSFTNNV